MSVTPTLNYAAPVPRDWIATAWAAAFGLTTAAFNAWLIYLIVSAVSETPSVYDALKANPRAYSREIAPETIDALRMPIGLWVFAGLLVAAAAFGLALAIHLLASAAARQPDRLERYCRLKPIGAVATAVAFFFYCVASQRFWAMATRHVSVGSHSPLFEAVPLLLVAMLPVWILRHRLRPKPIDVAPMRPADRIT